jgi:hypothetical protein
VTVRLRKDGSVTDEKPYDPENVARPKEQRARFLTETDCNHLRDIMWLKRARGNLVQADISLGPDAASVAILMALTKSGRLRFGRPSGPVLREGPARRASAAIAWGPSCALAEGAARVGRTAPRTIDQQYG